MKTAKPPTKKQWASAVKAVEDFGAAIREIKKQLGLKEDEYLDDKFANIN